MARNALLYGATAYLPTALPQAAKFAVHSFGMAPHMQLAKKHLPGWLSLGTSSI
jgi:hypothetical protein